MRTKLGNQVDEIKTIKRDKKGEIDHQKESVRVLPKLDERIKIEQNLEFSSEREGTSFCYIFTICSAGSAP